MDRSAAIRPAGPSQPLGFATLVRAFVAGIAEGRLPFTISSAGDADVAHVGCAAHHRVHEATFASRRAATDGFRQEISRHGFRTAATLSPTVESPHAAHPCRAMRASMNV